MAPSQHLIDSSDNECDPEYVPPGTQTPTPAARDTRGKPSVVTSSQYDEERILTSTTFRSISGSEGASGSTKASGSKSSHSTGSNEATASGLESEGDALPTDPA